MYNLVIIVSGRVKDASHSGPPRYLSDEEEAELVRFLAKWDMLEPKNVRTVVKQIVEAKGITKCPVSNVWWESFRTRHPHLTLRTVEKLSYARFVTTDSTVIC